jgi:hypothetical protein
MEIIVIMQIALNDNVTDECVGDEDSSWRMQ